METKHTNSEWVIVRNHPVFEHEVLIMSNMMPSAKSINKGKLICRVSDVRGDSFIGLEKSEREANVELIRSAPEMHDNLSEINFYAKQALKSLDNNSLSEVRGLLEGIIKKSLL